eukprot:gene4777-9503_t
MTSFTNMSGLSISEKIGKFAICSSTIKGRHCIATSNFKKGDVILIEEPHAMVINNPYREVACGLCGTLCIDGRVYALSAEDSVRYCSEACITRDYPEHKIECGVLNRLSDLSIQNGDSPCRLLVRIASLRKLEGSEINPLGNNSQPSMPTIGKKNTFRTIMTLEAKRTHMSMSALKEVSKVAMAVSDLVQKGVDGLLLSSDEATTLLFAIQCNAHQICDNNRHVALGLFPTTSMLNHSCVPNCSHHFLFEAGRWPRLVMVAMEDIPEGDELCYSYVPLYQSTGARQNQLDSAYGFQCDCNRCHRRGSTGSEPSDFPNDDVIDQPLPSPDDDRFIHRLLSQLEAYEESSSSEGTGSIQALEALLKTLSSTDSDNSNDNDVSDVSVAAVSPPPPPPCHRVLLQVYCFLANKLSQHAKDIDHNDVSQHCTNTIRSPCFYDRCVVGFAALGLGCIYHFTHTVQQESADLEQLIGDALQRLHRRDPETLGELTCLSDASLSSSQSVEGDNSNLFAMFARDCLKQADFRWTEDSAVMTFLQSSTTASRQYWTIGEPLYLSFHKSARITTDVCRGQQT